MTHDRARRRVAVLMVSIRSDGGAETLLRTLVDELAGEPYEIEVFTLKRIRDEHRLELEARGVPCRAFPAHRLVSPSRFVRLVRALRAGRFDVIHTNLPPANIIGALAGFVLRTPVVATLHNVETRADRHWYHGRAERFVLRWMVARVIAVGDRTAQARRRVLGERRVHVLHNAVAPSSPLTPDERDRVRASVMADPAAVLLLAVGRLTEQKAHADLLRAFAAVRERRADVELAIAGRGPLHDALASQIESLGLGAAAHLLGSRSDVRRLLRAADVYVMSSRWEGLPVALLEAMEAGLPVVATSVGDVPEVLADGSGRLVPPADVDALATAILDALEDVRRPGGDAGSDANAQLVRQRYSSHAWARAMVGHFEDAIRTDGT